MLLPETPALLALRQAVRAWTLAFEPRRRVVVALSGGADSLALTAAAVAEADSVDALIVDHRLQPGSMPSHARPQTRRWRWVAGPRRC